MQIVQACQADIPEVYALEQAVEKGNPASLATLKSRFAMFKEGFLVARLDGKIVGYVESCMWDRNEPHFESRPDFFSDYHRRGASTLYLIFAGVAPQHRRKGIASKMISALMDVGREYDAQKMHAVCRDDHLQLYSKLGLSPVRSMTGFLPEGGGYNLMEINL